VRARHPPAPIIYYQGHDLEFAVGTVRATDGDGRQRAVDTEDPDGALLVHIPTEGLDHVVLGYRVGGTVSQVSGGVQMEWRAVGACGHEVASTDVTVTADLPPEALSCLAGEPRSAMYCTASDMGPDATVAHFLQADMASTDRLDIVVTYPEGAAEGEPLLTQRWSLASAFAVTPATASVFGVLLLVLVG